MTAKWLVACLALTHYLNQCWHVVNGFIRNKLQWNLDENSNIFIQENVSENVVCNMSAILSQSQGVKHPLSLWTNHKNPSALALLLI